MSDGDGTLNVVLHYGSWKKWKNTRLERFFALKPDADDNAQNKTFILPKDTVLFVRDSSDKAATRLSDLLSKASDKKMYAFLEISGALMHGKISPNQTLYVARATMDTTCELQRERSSTAKTANNKKKTLPVTGLSASGKNYAIRPDHPEHFAIQYALPLAGRNYTTDFGMPPGLFWGYPLPEEMKASPLLFEMQRSGLIRRSASGTRNELNELRKRRESKAFFKGSTALIREFEAWGELDKIVGHMNLSPSPKCGGLEHLGKWESSLMPGQSLQGTHALVLNLAAVGMIRPAGLLAWASSTGPHPARRFYILGAPKQQSPSVVPAGGTVVFAHRADSDSHTGKAITQLDGEWRRGAFMAIEWLHPEQDFAKGAMRIIAAASWAENPRDLAFYDMAMRSLTQALVQRTLIHSNRIEVLEENCFKTLQDPSQLAGNFFTSDTSLVTLIAHLSLDRHVVRAEPRDGPTTSIANMTEVMFGISNPYQVHGKLGGKKKKNTDSKQDIRYTGAQAEEDFTRYVDARGEMMIEDKDFSTPKAKTARPLEDPLEQERKKRQRTEDDLLKQTAALWDFQPAPDTGPSPEQANPAFAFRMQ